MRAPVPGRIKIFKFNRSGNAIVIHDSFDLPKKDEGGVQGLTTDGEFLYIPSRGGALVRKVNKSGAIIEEINIPGEGISGGLVWTGSHFWGVTGGGNLTKYSHDWQVVGQIYPVADGTWAIAWDGDYIWALQRTCESWTDAKMFQINPLILTTTNYVIVKDDNPYYVTVKSNSSDYGLRFNESQNKISFEIYGKAGSKGRCYVFIPTDLVLTPYKVSIDGIPIDFSMSTEGSRIIINFEYEHSYHEVEIQLKIELITPSIPWIHILPSSLIFVALFNVWVYYKRRKL
ncbi:MAG: hypothetical protein ACFFDN_35190 [Candidatus Hodarchaeota archaeon]